MRLIPMRKLSLYLLLTAALFSNACQKNCDNKPTTCSERPPTNEACLAYFQRWFYNAGNNTCELISYSGCGQYGSATQADCEACLCD